MNKSNISLLDFKNATNLSQHTIQKALNELLDCMLIEIIKAPRGSHNGVRYGLSPTLFGFLFDPSLANSANEEPVEPALFDPSLANSANEEPRIIGITRERACAYARYGISKNEIEAFIDFLTRDRAKDSVSYRGTLRAKIASDDSRTLATFGGVAQKRKIRSFGASKMA